MAKMDVSKVTSYMIGMNGIMHIYANDDFLGERSPGEAPYGELVYDDRFEATHSTPIGTEYTLKDTQDG